MDSTIGRVIEAYLAFFGRIPDRAGLEYWVSEIDSGNISFSNMLGNWWNEQEETKEKFGEESLTPENFITVVYVNMLGREVDESGLNYWVAEVQNSVISENMIIEAIINAVKSGNGEDNQALNNRVEVSQKFIESGVEDSAKAKEVLSKVDNSIESVEDATTQIEIIKKEEETPVELKAEKIGEKTEEKISNEEGSSDTSNNTVGVDNTAPKIDGEVSFGTNNIELTPLEDATLKLLNQETQEEIYQEGVTANESNSIALEAMESVTTIDIALADSANNSSLLDDMILGTDGADNIVGTTDNDTIYGFGGDDIIDGRSGNDVIDGGLGDDILIGGDGLDTFNINEGKDKIFDGSIEDTINIGTEGILAIDLEDDFEASNYLSKIDINNQGIIEINGTDSSDEITIGTGINNIDGKEGDDTLMLTGENLADATLHINNIERIQLLETLDESIGEMQGANVVLGDNIMNHSDSNIVVMGSREGDTIDATDYIVTTDSEGNTQGLLIDGFYGDDTITGTAGDDILIGGDGNDTIDGGAGDDTIDLSGSGSDTVTFSEDSGSDTVTGFDSDDKIDFSSIADTKEDISTSSSVAVVHNTVYYLFNQSSGSADSSGGASSAINDGTSYSGSSASFFISDDDSSAGYSWNDVADSNDGVAESELSLMGTVDSAVSSEDQLIV